MRIALLLGVVLASSALAAVPGAGKRPEDRRPTFIAAIKGVNGARADVKIRALGEDQFRPAQVGQQLLEGSSVWTEPGSTAKLHVGGIAIMNLAPGTLVTFAKSKENYPILCRANVEEGTVWTTVQPGQPFTVEAANASGRARGTQFRTTFDAATRDSQWEMIEGRLDLYRLPSNSLEKLSAGQRITVGPNGAPRGPVPIQLASITEAKGLFSRTLGGSEPPASNSVSTTTAPMGTNVVYMTRPPGGYPPPITLGAGATGVMTVRPPSFGAVLTKPIIGIGTVSGIGVSGIRTPPFGTKIGTVISQPAVTTIDPRVTNPGIKIGNPVLAPAAVDHFNDGGLIQVVGQNDISKPIKTGPSFNQGIGIRDINRRDMAIRQQNLGNNFGGNNFGGRAGNNFGGNNFGNRAGGNNFGGNNFGAGKMGGSFGGRR